MVIPAGSGQRGCAWMSDPGVVRAGAYGGLDSKTSVREPAGSVDLTGRSRRETDLPPLRASKLGQDSILKIYIIVSPQIRYNPWLFHLIVTHR